jgi:hypothetical protein
MGFGLTSKSPRIFHLRPAFGDCYYIPLTGDKPEECPVMCYHHDVSDVESVSTSLDEFLKGIEKSCPD